MKKMKLNWLLALTVMVFGLVGTSCVGGDDEETPTYHVDYVTISGSSDGLTIWFEGDDGLYAPYALPSNVSFGKHIGQRALIYYTESGQIQPGYKKVITLYAVQLSKTKVGVEEVGTPEGLVELGNEGLTVDQVNTHFNGQWLDLVVSYYAGDVTRDFTLAVPSKDLIPDDAEVPEGYKYMELHQKVSESPAKQLPETAIISFKLPDAYNPAIQSGKGIYLKIDNIFGTTNYIKIDYPTLLKPVE